jgi:RNA ligase (TIGR02306 family)
MERKLATLRKISEIKPIEGADAIELAVIDGWNVVAAKAVGHKVGDLVIYCEIDSFLPIEPEFEFLRKSSFKKMGDQEGFRLKTIRLRGQTSQGLIIPLKDGIEVMKRRGSLDSDISSLSEGDDVSLNLGIVKYDPPIPAELAGKVKGNFPSFIRKTDEERIQNLSKYYEKYKESKMYVTEKLDGSSATYFVKDGVFGVCSRNLELAEPEEFVEGLVICEDGIERPRQQNTFWKTAVELGLKEKMLSLGKNICFQGELIGEGIQGNPYKIKGQTVKFFNVFDIDSQEYLGLDGFQKTIVGLGLDTVPIIEFDFELQGTVEGLLKYAEAPSLLNQDFSREGIVIRSHDRKISFKVISNQFLLNNKD